MGLKMPTFGVKGLLYENFCPSTLYSRAVKIFPPSHRSVNKPIFKHTLLSQNTLDQLDTLEIERMEGAPLVIKLSIDSWLFLGIGVEPKFAILSVFRVSDGLAEF